jgi:hypothetical protein
VRGRMMTDTHQDHINASNKMYERIREHDVALVRVSDAVKTLSTEHRTSAERTTAAIQDINSTLQTVGEHLTVGRLKDTEFLGALASIQETNTQLRSDLLFERSNRKQCKDDVMATINQMRADTDERMDIKHNTAMEAITTLKSNDKWLTRSITGGLMAITIGLIVFIYQADVTTMKKVVNNSSVNSEAILGLRSDE